LPPFIKGIISIIIVTITLFCGAKNAFYWTNSGPHLAQNQSKIYYFYPDAKDNLTIYANDVNIEIVEGADFHIEYYGDDIPDIFQDDSTLTISVANSHSNPKYSITSFPTNNATLRIVEPDTTFYNNFDFEGVSNKISIAYMLTYNTMINTQNTQLKISSLLASYLNINNIGGYTNLASGNVSENGFINSEKIYANLLINSHYAYNLTGSDLTFKGKKVDNPYTYVYLDEEAINSMNLNANQISLDLSGDFMSSSDYDEYQYVQNIEQQVKDQETPTPAP